MLKKDTVRITAENRDKGKIFLIEELPAAAIEWWAMQALLAMARNKPELIDEAQAGSGMALLIKLGIKAFFSLPPQDFKPLWDEMLRCVRIVRDPKHLHHADELMTGDIEEVSTLFRLRSEVIKLHTGFFIPGLS